jgi:hypothetical protein
MNCAAGRSFHARPCRLRMPLCLALPSPQPPAMSSVCNFFNIPRTTASYIRFVFMCFRTLSQECHSKDFISLLFSSFCALHFLEYLCFQSLAHSFEKTWGWRSPLAILEHSSLFHSPAVSPAPFLNSQLPAFGTFIPSESSVLGIHRPLRLEWKADLQIKDHPCR